MNIQTLSHEEVHKEILKALIASRGNEQEAHQLIVRLIRAPFNSTFQAFYIGTITGLAANPNTDIENSMGIGLNAFRITADSMQVAYENTYKNK